VRTTLTLDDDVSIQLKRVQGRVKKSFKELVNEALRLGLRQMTHPAPQSKRYRTRSADLGRCSFGSVDDVAEVLAVAEGESFR
jgi:hypothetical protein